MVVGKSILIPMLIPRRNCYYLGSIPPCMIINSIIISIMKNPPPTPTPGDTTVPTVCQRRRIRFKAGHHHSPSSPTVAAPMASSAAAFNSLPASAFNSSFNEVSAHSSVGVPMNTEHDSPRHTVATVDDAAPISDAAPLEESAPVDEAVPVHHERSYVG